MQAEEAFVGEVAPKDAFFTTSTGLGALGIASGQSDIVRIGNSSPSSSEPPYAQFLMANCLTAFSSYSQKPIKTTTKTHAIDPAYILAHAQQATRKPGTAAVSLVAMQPDSRLCVSSLGNCKVMLIRGGGVWDETDFQVYDGVAGRPKRSYQLGHPTYAKGADSIHDAQRSVHVSQFPTNLASC